MLHVLTDPVTEDWIQSLNPSTESLLDCYRDRKPRMRSYREMVRRILAALRQGQNVCAVFYGHPGVFVYPSHEAIRRARAEGFKARMLPGVSAEDCLFADLGVDPARDGCQSFEATDFLARRRRFEPTTALVLWQVGAIGDLSYRKSGRYPRRGLRVLTEVLQQDYPADHEVVVYEAPQFPICDPIIDRRPLHTLPRGRVTGASTLYVPPLAVKRADPQMLKRLGLVGHRRAHGSRSGDALRPRPGPGSRA